MNIPPGDPLVSAHNELADLYSNYLRERKFDEERVKGILSSSVTRYPLAQQTAATSDQVEPLFSEAVTAIAHLQEIKIDPKAVAVLAKVATEKMNTLCAQWNLSQRRRKEGRTTAYRSAVQHVLYLNRIRDPMELQTFYRQEVIEKLKGKMQQWQSVLDGNEPEFPEVEVEAKNQKKPRKSKAKKAEGEGDSNGSEEGDKVSENEEGADGEEKVEEREAEVKKKAGGRGKRKAQDDAPDANEDEAATKAPAAKRKRSKPAAKNSGNVEELLKEGPGENVGGNGSEESKKEEPAKKPVKKLGRGRGKAAAKKEPLDVANTEVKEEEVADKVGSVGAAQKNSVVVKIEESDVPVKEEKPAKTPATKRGRGNGKAAAKTQAQDVTPKSEVKKEASGDDPADGTPTPKRKRGRPPKAKPGNETPKIDAGNESIVKEGPPTDDLSSDIKPSPDDAEGADDGRA